MPGAIVELEFDIGETDLPLIWASEEAACSLRIEEVRQRTDGSVLEYVSVENTDPQQMLKLLEESDELVEARILSENGDQALLELVSESPIATVLADNRTRFTNVAATAGNGRLVAEVSPHVDVPAAIEAFLDQYPEAKLVARRETDRDAPTFTKTQFRERLLSDLTDRQLQALRTAYEGGYFDWPRDCTAEDVADELDVATSTLSQHLRVAQGKLLEQLFAK